MLVLRVCAQCKVLAGVVMYWTKGSRARPDDRLARCVRALREQGSAVVGLLNEVMD
jgi:hypothetical protein